MRFVPETSPGRDRPETPSPTRSEFQRDRDRILHTKSFRRLKHKTQVFIAPLGDHYATRLTHTLEVSQIARTIARALNLNEDLTESHRNRTRPWSHAVRTRRRIRHGRTAPWRLPAQSPEPQNRRAAGKGRQRPEPDVGSATWDSQSLQAARRVPGAAIRGRPVVGRTDMPDFGRGGIPQP